MGDKQIWWTRDIPQAVDYFDAVGIFFGENWKKWFGIYISKFSFDELKNESFYDAYAQVFVKFYSGDFQTQWNNYNDKEHAFRSISVLMCSRAIDEYRKNQKYYNPLNIPFENYLQELKAENDIDRYIYKSPYENHDFLSLLINHFGLEKVRSLTKQQKMVLVLTYDEKYGYSNAEIARILDTTSNNISKIHARAWESLRKEN